MPYAARVTRSTAGTRCHRPAGGYQDEVFVFFSNRVGCLGSLAISAVATLVLFLLLTR